jgi:hypothetical protein
MVYMLPRRQVLPGNNVPGAKPVPLLGQQFIPVRKSVEQPSIISWNGQGRGMNGEHSNGSNNSGGSDAIELWRSLYAKRLYGMK